MFASMAFATLYGKGGMGLKSNRSPCRDKEPMNGSTRTISVDYSFNDRQKTETHADCFWMKQTNVTHVSFTFGSWMNSNIPTRIGSISTHSGGVPSVTKRIRPEGERLAQRGYPPGGKGSSGWGRRALRGRGLAQRGSSKKEDHKLGQNNFTKLSWGDLKDFMALSLENMKYDFWDQVAINKPHSVLGGPSQGSQRELLTKFYDIFRVLKQISRSLFQFLWTLITHFGNHIKFKLVFQTVK